MKVLFSPQVNETDSLVYEFIGDKIIATYNGEIDEFDFTGLPDGEAITNYGEVSIVSTLPICPIIHAAKISGVLHITLLNFISEGAPREDLFPEWIEVE